MKIAIHISHPEQFHLFKNVIAQLRTQNHSVIITYNEKDVLGELISSSEFASIAYKVNARKNIDSIWHLMHQFLQKEIGLYKELCKHKPDILVGNSIALAHIGKFMSRPSIIINQDDFDLIHLTANIGYPFASTILCPDVCRTGKFKKKSIQYPASHALAYLHPKYFSPNEETAKKYVDTTVPFYILRLVKLSAHHDIGINGINDALAEKICERLSKSGNVFISAERKLSNSLEKYRLKIDPSHIHHLMSFADLFISDSQGMSEEAEILGTPTIRYTDFAGRMSFLEELEIKYQLGFSFKPPSTKNLFDKIEQILNMHNVKSVWTERKNKMLADKIDLASFLSWFIGNYPESKHILAGDDSYILNFK